MTTPISQRLRHAAPALHQEPVAVPTPAPAAEEEKQAWWEPWGASVEGPCAQGGKRQLLLSTVVSLFRMGAVRSRSTAAPA